MVQYLKEIRVVFFLYAVLVIVTGVMYPLFVTYCAHEFFPWEANGSLIVEDDVVVGSTLIGQFFDSAKYFWSRPSSTLPYPNNALYSSGSNFGPTNPAYLQRVQTRIDRLFKTKRELDKLVPIDLVTSSASGLDPDISPYAAYYQIMRIANARRIAPEIIANLVTTHITKRAYHFLGEPRVNVLELNLALDKIRSAHGRAPTKS